MSREKGAARTTARSTAGLFGRQLPAIRADLDQQRRVRAEPRSLRWTLRR